MIKYIFQEFCFSLLFICGWKWAAMSQEDEKDIMNNNEQNKEFSILKNGDIKLIKVSSFDDKDQPSEGFFCEKKINKIF